MEYEVIIVGAGPAGIFAALTLADEGIGPVLLLEQGKDLNQRDPSNPENRLCGWGGAGAYSDGKLMLSTEVGGFLREFIDEKSLFQLLSTTDGIYADHGAPDRIFGHMTPKLEALSDQARLADLELIPSRVRHIGTENCWVVLDRLRRSLSGRVEVRTGQQVQTLLAENGHILGLKMSDGRTITSRFVVAAPGRSGAG